MNDNYINCVHRDECAEHRLKIESKQAASDANMKTLLKIITALLSIFTGIAVSIITALLLN